MAALDLPNQAPRPAGEERPPPGGPLVRLLARPGQLTAVQFGMLLFLASLLVRALAMAVLDWKGGVLADGFDTQAANEFLPMAQGLVVSGDFTFHEVAGRLAPSAFQPPLYPLFLALVFFLRGTPPAAMLHDTGALLIVQAVNCLAGAAWGLVVWRLTAALFSETAGRVAGLIACLYPTLVYSVVEVHSHNFTQLALLSFLYFACLLAAGRELRLHWLRLGIAAGAAMLLRAETVLLCMGILVLVAALRRSWPAARQAALAGLVAAAVLAPWIVRNYHALGGHLAHTTTLGLNLYRGQGPLATGTGYRPDGSQVNPAGEVLEALRALPWSADYEVKQDRMLRAATLDYVRTHPGHPLALVPRKLFAFLIADLSHPKGRLPVVWLPGLLLLGTAVAGMVRFRARARQLAPLYATLGFYVLIVCVFFVLPRYRMMVDPVLFVFAAGALAGRRTGAEERTEAPAPDALSAVKGIS